MTGRDKAIGGTRGLDGFTVGTAFLAAYVALQAASTLPGPALPLGNPWNPPAGLGLALLMVFGLRQAVALFAAMLVAQLAPQASFAIWLLHVTAAAAATGGYAVAAKVLREEVDFDPRLSRLRDVMVFVVVVVAAAMAVTALQAAIYAAGSLIPWEFYAEFAFRAWASDVIGILAVTPALLVHRSRLPRTWPSWPLLVEALVFAMVVGLAAWLLFGPLFEAALRAFYLLFLPLIWLAVRHGLPGAVLGILAILGSLHVSVRVVGAAAMSMNDLQLLMLALVVTNLVLGALVSERRRADSWLRAHQAELAHASRLSATGAMASALAHELNQPLTATISYVRACQMGLRRQEADPELLELMDKAVAQAERAGMVVRGLRAFLRKGAAPRAPADPRTLVAEALALAAPEAAQHEVVLRTTVEEDLPPVSVDPIQIQQVLLNLVRNAIESLAEQPGRRQVRVGVRAAADGLEISVADNGPGLAAEISDRLFSPFATTKSSGMGLGLAISRSIVEAHGGRLWAEPGHRGGAVFRFILPAAEEKEP